jgi:hypothetical protein
MNIQVHPELLPAIRAAYTHDVAETFGHLRPDEREQLTAALKAVDDEEVRMMRLYAAGKVTDALWNAQWQEWQDRRARIRLSLEEVENQQQIHIENLDAALKIIAQVGVVYNRLQRSDQRELLRHMVERVMVNPEGLIRLELRAPFAYLQDITEQVRESAQATSDGEKKAKTGRLTTGLSKTQSSDSFLFS